MDSLDHPHVENAPGIRWKRGKRGQWIASWRARSDLIKAGFRPTSLQVFAGHEITDFDRVWISERCQDMQSEMLTWGKGGIPHFKGFDGSLRSLIAAYTSDPDSGYRKIRYATKLGYDSHMRTLAKEHGDEQVRDIDARLVLRWHDQWLDGEHIAKAHALVTMLRSLMTFGKVFLKSAECADLKEVLGEMRFPMSKPRRARLTAAHAIAIRRMAHAMGAHSIALAQALQFELMLRQKDVIGEWVPASEPGLSDVVNGNEKWLRGLRWNEIDNDLVLRHTTSKRNKDIEVSLKLAPMVMEEIKGLKRLPDSGPVIVSEATGLPYIQQRFRREWREIADAAGVPQTVYNMDSRAGAISEADEAGADTDSIRQTATHSNAATTHGYMRAQARAAERVMQLRAKHRNGSETGDGERTPEPDSALSAPPPVKSTG